MEKETRDWNVAMNWTLMVKNTSGIKAEYSLNQPVWEEYLTT